MRKAYKVVIKETNKGYLVKVPDFDAITQGDDIADCMYMARDLICVASMGCEDLNQPIPEPDSVEFASDTDDIITYVDVDTSELWNAQLDYHNDIITHVDVDIDEYRRKHDTRKIKKPYLLHHG